MQNLGRLAPRVLHPPAPPRSHSEPTSLLVDLGPWGLVIPPKFLSLRQQHQLNSPRKVVENYSICHHPLNILREQQRNSGSGHQQRRQSSSRQRTLQHGDPDEEEMRRSILLVPCPSGCLVVWFGYRAPRFCRALVILLGLLFWVVIGLIGPCGPYRLLAAFELKGWPWWPVLSWRPQPVN